MYPPIFQIAANDSGVTTLLGSSPTRFWPFGMAPQNEARPYAVHQLVYGTPENTLACPPSVDNIGIQIDAYAKTVTDSRAVAEALRRAFEEDAYVVALNGEFWEQATGLWRSSFTVEFWQDR
jgi:hypothetical protein